MSDVKIYSGSSQVRIMEIKNILENEQIDYQELNKSDSSFLVIHGDIEIYVAQADEQRALEVLANNRS
ncbi:DUF2007 domain-containing protein [Gelidibacter salicanalis]|uniref:DUF2007 domain-containing protein n=1 Tax=Gelidibacter salicanalis TaxID=291193 RepID=A0A5C7AB58_9FLAO|nr:DUF2007 domain-containing protein [Gelidibacter salicanalis]TXE06030.1 DUF2007 domain-containing protein [Gelidibacter salicanalis]